MEKTSLPTARDMAPAPREDLNVARNTPGLAPLAGAMHEPRPITAGSLAQPNAPATVNSTTEESRRNELHVPAHLATGVAIGVSPADHASLDEPHLNEVEQAELQRLNAVDPVHAKLGKTGPGFEPINDPKPKTDGSKVAGELPKKEEPKPAPKDDVKAEKPADPAPKATEPDKGIVE